MNSDVVIRNLLDYMCRTAEEHTAGHRNFALKANINPSHYSTLRNSATNIEMRTFLDWCAAMNELPWEVMFNGLRNHFDFTLTDKEKNRKRKKKKKAQT